MTQARAWIERQLRRRTRLGLDAALLTDRGASYAASRLGLIGARALLRTGLHVAELAILTRDFPFQFLTPLFAMRALPPLIASVHWGALETLRGAVRHDVLGRRPGAARASVETWLGWTGVSGLALTLSIGAFIAAQPDPEGGPDGLYGAFAIVCSVVTASELWTRTYHAGVYALGRVYRPAWSFFAPELLEIAVLFQAYPRLGPFALHASLLLGAGLRAGILWVYARSAYRARQLDLPTGFRLRALRRLRIADLASSARHAAATLPLSLDRMLLIALLRAPSPAGALPLALPYYALRPVAAFAHGWARGFYADFVRLDVASLGVLRTRFERLLRRVAYVAGTVSTLGLGVGAYALFGAPGLWAALWLLPLAVVRSLFALSQVRGFAYGALWGLTRTGLVLLAGLWIATSLRLSDRALLALAVALLALTPIAAGRIQSRAGLRRAEQARRLSLSAWLAGVNAERAPLRLAIALVDTRVTRPRAAIGEIAEGIGAGRCTRAGRAWLLWWEPAARAKSRSELAKLLAGTVQRLELVTADSGARALSEALSRRVLPQDLATALAAARPGDRHAELQREAQRLVPEANSIDLSRSSPALGRLSGHELALVRRAITAEAREQHIVPRSAAFQVAVYAPRGEPELVFVWPRRAAQGGELARLVRMASWRDSIA